MFREWLVVFGLLVSLSLKSESSLLRVRLGGSVQNIKAQGRIEVFYNRSWGTVCENGLSDKVCIVVCRQLGLSGGLCVKGENDGMCVTNNRKIFAELKDNTVPVWTGNVECTGNEENIGQCLMTNFGEANCGHHEDGGCICGDAETEDPHHHGESEVRCNQSRHRIRPFEGSRVTGIGIAEVQNEEGQWGVICDDGWDDADAFVFCRCLGYKDSRFFKAMIHSSASQWLPLLPVLYGQVDCTLNPDRPSSPPANIWDCKVRQSGFQCDARSEAATLSCTSDIFKHEKIRYEVEASCEGSLLEGCFHGLDEHDEGDRFLLKPECEGVHFEKRTGLKMCFKIDMLRCYPFRIKNKKGLIEMCYDIHYQNVKEMDHLLKHGSSWVQGICCRFEANSSVAASLAPSRKKFEKIKADNRSPNNLTMDCFQNDLYESNDSLEFPVEVHHGSPLACYVDLSSWNTDLLLTVPDCYFMADPEDTSVSFQFLQDKCITSNQLGIELFSPSATRWGFRFRVPMFENKNSLYIVCLVHLCDPSQESKLSCDRSCWLKNSTVGKNEIMPQKRRRSAIDDHKFNVDGGPIVILSGEDEPLFIKRGNNFVVETSRGSGGFYCR